jgi:hypothetical protein
MAIFKKKKKIDEEFPEPPDFLEFPEVEQYNSSGEIPDFPSLREPSQRIKEWKNEKPKKLPSKLTTPFKETKTKAKPRAKALYIKVEKFRDIVASIDMIAKKIEDLSDIAHKIKQIKAKEDSEIADWQNQLNVIKAKLEAIEENLESKI